MESLFNQFRTRLELTPMAFVRDFEGKINWRNRLVGILGQKGVGKSTLILQHIKMNDDLSETLYVEGDSFYFGGHRIYDLASEFYKRGGKRLYIDEIHKYKGWSTEIKMIYDMLPELSVVYSGSSLLALKEGGKVDLSRRVVEYSLPPLSFREYLNLSSGWNLRTSTLDEILKGKVDFPYGKDNHPIKLYEDYLKQGCYPFFLEEDYISKLNGAINQTVEYDIPRYAEMTVSSAVKLKKLMYILAQSVPYKPVYATLARDLDISRNVLPDYISYLEKTGLFNALRVKASRDGALQKVEKLYLGNSNIAESVSDKTPDEGTVRETMFLAWTKEVCRVTSSAISDFEIDGKTFEVGGKNKKGKQIKDAAEGYIVKDNIEYAFGKVIPIWMFGFIY